MIEEGRQPNQHLETILSLADKNSHSCFCFLKKKQKLPVKKYIQMENCIIDESTISHDSSAIDTLNTDSLLGRMGSLSQENSNLLEVAISDKLKDSDLKINKSSLIGTTLGVLGISALYEIVLCKVMYYQDFWGQGWSTFFNCMFFPTLFLSGGFNLFLSLKEDFKKSKHLHSFYAFSKTSAYGKIKKFNDCFGDVFYKLCEVICSSIVYKNQHNQQLSIDTDLDVAFFFASMDGLFRSIELMCNIIDKAEEVFNKRFNKGIF